MRPQPSAFVPITAAISQDSLPQRPPVFRPLSDDVTNGSSRRVHPLFRRIFDRSSSITRAFSEEHTSPGSGDAVIDKSGSEELLRPRRRRSISMDNYGRTTSPVASDAAAKTRHSFPVDTSAVAVPVPIRTQSGSSALFKVARARAQSAGAELEADMESDEEPVSIDPALAAAASNGYSDFLPDGSLDTISEQELSEYSGKLRALSDGAALHRHNKKSPHSKQHVIPNNRDRENPEQRLPGVSVGTTTAGVWHTPAPAPSPSSPFPTSSASASLDSTDRTAAAEALARRTACVANGMLRRSFSYDTSAHVHGHHRGSLASLEDVTNHRRKSMLKRRDSILGPRRMGRRDAGTTFRRWMRLGNEDDAVRRTASQTFEPRASMSSKASWRESGDSTLVNATTVNRRPKIASFFRRKQPTLEHL